MVNAIMDSPEGSQKAAPGIETSLQYFFTQLIRGFTQLRP